MEKICIQLEQTLSFIKKFSSSPSIAENIQNVSKDDAILIDENDLLGLIVPSVRHQLSKHSIRMLVNKSARYLKVPSADIELDCAVSHRFQGICERGVQQNLELTT